MKTWWALTEDQLRNKIAACAAHQLSLNEFEDWFRDESRNVHLWGNAELTGFVDGVEEIFSEWHFEGLKDVDMRIRLNEVAQRFCR